MSLPLILKIAVVACLLTGSVACSSGDTRSDTEPVEGDLRAAFQDLASAITSSDYGRQYDLQVPPSRRAACPKSLLVSLLESFAETNSAQMRASIDLYNRADYQDNATSGVDRSIVTVKDSVTGELYSLEFVREDGEWYFNDPVLKSGAYPECSIDSTTTAVPTLQTPSAIPGYTRFHSDRFRYSIQHPPDWLPEPSASFVYQNQTVYADFFSGPTKSGFTTNLNINGGSTGGLSRDQVYAREVQDAQANHGDDLSITEIQFLGQPAKRLSYTGGQLSGQEPFDQEQIIVVYDGQEWVLTFSAALGELPTFRDVFDTMAATFAPD